MAPTIKSYTILPVSIPAQKTLHQKAATHTIYLQPHAPKVPTEADTRSLFLVNIPIDSTPAHLRNVFATLLSSAGNVEDVIFEGTRQQKSVPVPAATDSVGKKRKRGAADADIEMDASLPEVWDRQLHASGSTAVVVFVDSRSAEASLKAIRKMHKLGKSERFPVWGEGLKNKIPRLGSERYRKHHEMRFVDKATLQANVDAYMTGFNSKEERRKRENNRKRNEPDEDGFVTVTRGGRTGPARREDAEEKRREMEEKEEKKRKEREGEGFYRFQVREKRKMEQNELVKQFEEDKRRVEMLREAKGKRGIRPET
jgi:ribosomal RNA-processing protein 7